MKTLTPDLLKTLTQLSRIHCTAEEEEALLEGLQKILAYIDQLNAVDTEGVEPCTQIIEEEPLLLRKDEVSERFDRELFLNQAPVPPVNGMICLPPFLEPN